MKKIRRSWPQGFAGSIVHGCAKMGGVLLLITIFVLVLLGPSRVAADQPSSVTQLTLLQTLVQVTGDSDKFSRGATAADYVQWAKSRGISPSGGWNPSIKLTREALASTLTTLLNIAPGKLGSDPVRVLAREGIVLSDKNEVTRGDLNSLLDENIFKGREDDDKKRHHKPPSPHCPGEDGNHDGEHNNNDGDCHEGDHGDDDHHHPPPSDHDDHHHDDHHDGDHRD